MPTRQSARVDAYLEQVPEPARSTLSALRAAIREAAPTAKETISYSIPAFRLGGVIAGFAVNREHCTLYTFSGTVTAKLEHDLAGYDVSKGSVRFPHDRPLPAALVKTLIDRRLVELAARRGRSTRKQP